MVFIVHFVVGKTQLLYEFHGVKACQVNYENRATMIKNEENNSRLWLQNRDGLRTKNPEA